MKEAEAIKAVTAKWVNHWKFLLGIDDWDVVFRYAKLEDGTLGECGVEAVHKSAGITVDIEKHKNKQELLETIRHELIHIMHAEFELYRNATIKYLTPNMIDMADDIYSIGAEGLVLKVEHMLNKLDIDINGK